MLHDVGNNRDCDVDVDHRNNTSYSCHIVNAHRVSGAYPILRNKKFDILCMTSLFSKFVDIKLQIYNLGARISSGIGYICVHNH